LPKLKRRAVALMGRRLLVLTVVLIITATMSLAAGPAWAQKHGGCDGPEGDHGMGCIPVADDECEDDGWRPFDIFENLFGDEDWCVYFSEQGSTQYESY
jgi:hypothetical protein